MAAQSSKMVETAGGGQGTTKAVSMFSNLISQSSNFVMAGVKNLVVKKHNLPLTKIVDEIMEQKQGKVNEEFKYLDPKILRGQESGQVCNYYSWSQTYLILMTRCPEQKHHLRMRWCLWLVEAITLSIKTCRLKRKHPILKKHSFAGRIM